MSNASWKNKGGELLKNILGKNKKKTLIIFYFLLVVLLVFLTFQFIGKKAEKKAVVEKQKIEESRQQRMSTATWSRVSFFESLPINVTLAVPSHLEGNYRMIKSDNKVDFLYIKNPEFAAPMLSVKVGKQGELQLAEGEKELKSDCTNYSFSYKLYSFDSYTGQDKEGFSQAIYDFSFFLAGGDYFKCFPR
jgi:uncharacterized MAPEG superfamily protein